MQNKKETITIHDGSSAEAQTPVIISASRSTDIPAFYGDWFISRWEKGCALNGQILLMRNLYMYLLKMLDILCFGQKIQNFL